MHSSAAAFGLAGGAVVLVGVASILLGVPASSRDLPPLSGSADVGARLSEIALPLSAAIGALVAAVISLLVGTRRLRARPGAIELLVLGGAIEVSLIEAAHRIAYAPDGAVLPAAVAALTGGVAVIVASFAAAAAGGSVSSGPGEPRERGQA